MKDKNQKCVIMLNLEDGTITYLGLLHENESCPQRTKDIYIYEGEIINFDSTFELKDYHIVSGNEHVYKHLNGSVFI